MRDHIARSAGRVLGGVLLGLGLLAGCSHGSGDPGTDTDRPASGATPTGARSTQPVGRVAVVGTIARGLAAPWGIAFLPDGDAVVTERDTTRVLRIAGPRHRVRTLGRVEAAVPLGDRGGEAGLLGVAVSPTYRRDHQLYFYVSTAEDNRIMTARVDRGRLRHLRPIFTGIPNGFIHDGGRLVFGPDGYLYVSTGEGGESSRAQDRDSLGGKILRLTRSGDPAPGNPFGTAVWSYGHRNVQGLAFVGRQLWASEFGQDTFDELNRIRRGGDYGWPLVEGGGGTGQGFIDPQVTWSTEEASPSGLAFTDGHLWLAALHGERLWRVRVRAQHASRPTPFFVGTYGRLRTVVVDPHGMLWVTTSNRDGRGDPGPGDDRILLVRP